MLVTATLYTNSNTTVHFDSSQIVGIDEPIGGGSSNCVIRLADQTRYDVASTKNAAVAAIEAGLIANTPITL